MQLYGYLKMLVDFILLLSEGAGLRFDGIYQGAKAAAQEEGHSGLLLGQTNMCLTFLVMSNGTIYIVFLKR